MVFIWADTAIIPAVEHAREKGVVVRLLHGGDGMSAHHRLLHAVDEADVLTREILLRALA